MLAKDADQLTQAAQRRLTFVSHAAAILPNPLFYLSGDVARSLTFRDADVSRHDY